MCRLVIQRANNLQEKSVDMMVASYWKYFILLGSAADLWYFGADLWYFGADLWYFGTDPDPRIRNSD